MFFEYTGWQKCLLDYQSGNHRAYCKPSYKPLLCTVNAWDDLKAKFKVRCPSRPRIIAPVKAVAPSYLSIEGHEKCLDIHNNGQYIVKCLPEAQPVECSKEIWERVKDSFIGTPCPTQPILLGIGGTPPAHLGVDGFQNCLETFEAGPSHTELCLPSSRPTACKAESWKKLKHEGLFKGVKCPLTGLPPVYLSIDGYKKCLSTYQVIYIYNRWYQIVQQYIILYIFLQT